MLMYAYPEYKFHTPPAEMHILYPTLEPPLKLQRIGDDSSTPIRNLGITISCLILAGLNIIAQFICLIIGTGQLSNEKSWVLGLLFIMLFTNLNGILSGILSFIAAFDEYIYRESKLFFTIDAISIAAIGTIALSWSIYEMTQNTGFGGISFLILTVGIIVDLILQVTSSMLSTCLFKTVPISQYIPVGYGRKQFMEEAIYEA